MACTLRWDISDAQAALRRVVERGGVPGKAIQVGTQMVGYGTYVIGGRLGGLVDLCVLPEWSHAEVGEPLLQDTLAAMRQQGVLRIEKLGLSIDCPWLIPAFEHEGFQTHWREFLRIELPQAPALPPRLLWYTWNRGKAPDSRSRGNYAGGVCREYRRCD